MSGKIKPVVHMIQHSFAVGNACIVFKKSLKRNSIQNAGILIGDEGKEI